MAHRRAHVSIEFDNSSSSKNGHSTPASANQQKVERIFNFDEGTMKVGIQLGSQAFTTHAIALNSASKPSLQLTRFPDFSRLSLLLALFRSALTLAVAILPGPEDNCALVNRRVEAGTRIHDDVNQREWVLSTTLLEGHRFCYNPIAKGNALLSWGIPFGYALVDINPGRSQIFIFGVSF